MKVRTEARREAILDVARQVFMEAGFERASMSEIARQVGGSKATLYGYFPSKEALFAAATLAEGERQIEGTVREFEVRAAEDLGSALLRLGTALVTFLSAPQTVAAHRVVLAEAGRHDIGQQFFEQGPKIVMRRTAEVLSAAMAQGEFRSADPDIAAHHLFGLLSSEVHPLWYQREVVLLKPDVCVAMARRAVDVFLRGYGTQRQVQAGSGRDAQAD